ncbi:AmmeMemoRadiSam system protein A [Desulfoluna spongiiphila]|uniref:AmmeMemoRadiSam system protein A n=1 Tax=Desulfoluna spongiiphila TaxID=419481 RepID=UPI0012552A52|nr:AmmeMemoRadiSam system protein A [Desulfoluna spongiiphila]VVS93482.1 ammecr1 [Desulfoluna spongiiphila]
MTSDPIFTLDRHQGMALLRLARKTLAEALHIPWGTADEEAPLDHPCLERKQATFVTLTRQGLLRGCIGTLLPVTTLRDSVQENTYSAAFRDQRFNPVEPGEFDELHIELSLLTEPQPLVFESPSALLTGLRTGLDGVIIKKGGATATFLPQVWEQIPNPEAFLSQLCLKAGLSGTAWQEPGLDVFTYQVQHFHE